MKTYIVTAEGWGERVERLVSAEHARQAVELFIVCEAYADFFKLGSFDDLDSLICSEVPAPRTTAGILEWDCNWISDAKYVGGVKLTDFPNS